MPNRGKQEPHTFKVSIIGLLTSLNLIEDLEGGVEIFREKEKAGH